MIYYSYTEYLGSILVITDKDGNIEEEANYDAWGRVRNPDNWTYSGTQPLSILYRGFTGHEMLPHFVLINMNGRMYDPVTGRMLSPDNYIQGPNNPQNYNRYVYALNNPLVYTDPDGEWVHLVVGAVVGGFMGYIAGDMAGATGWELAGYIGVGAFAGALGAGVGAGVSSTIAGGSFGAGFIGSSTAMTATTSFATGAAIGGAGGFSSGFVAGTGFSLMQGQNFDQALWSGTKSGFIAGISGALIGGITSGISASTEGRTFWTGETRPANAYASFKGQPYSMDRVNRLQSADPDSWEGRLYDYRGGYWKGVKYSIENPIHPTDFSGYVTKTKTIPVAGFKGELQFRYFGDVPTGTSVTVSFNGNTVLTIPPGEYFLVPGTIPAGTSSVTITFSGRPTGFLNVSEPLRFQITGFYP